MTERGERMNRESYQKKKILELCADGVPCVGECKDCRFYKCDESVYDCDIQRLADFLYKNGVRVNEFNSK